MAQMAAKLLGKDLECVFIALTHNPKQIIT